MAGFYQKTSKCPGDLSFSHYNGYLGVSPTSWPTCLDWFVEGSPRQTQALSRQATNCALNESLGMSENGVYPQWNSHLVGIMISKTIGCRGTQHFQTNPFPALNFCFRVRSSILGGSLSDFVRPRSQMKTQRPESQWTISICLDSEFWVAVPAMRYNYTYKIC